jgi:hypothetical protein
MELIIRDIKASDNQIVKALFVKEPNGVENCIAYSRDHGFAVVYPLDRQSEDNARSILAKAVKQNYSGPAQKLCEGSGEVVE